MKNLITAVASIMLLLVFVLQFAAGMQMHQRLIRADIAIENFRDAIKEEGGVQPLQAERLCTELAKICGIGRKEVQVTGTTGPVPRGEEISYSVRFSLHQLIAANTFWGISDAENEGMFIEENYVISSYVDESEDESPVEGDEPGSGALTEGGGEHEELDPVPGANDPDDNGHPL